MPDNVVLLPVSRGFIRVTGQKIEWTRVIAHKEDGWFWAWSQPALEEGKIHGPFEDSQEALNAMEDAVFDMLGKLTPLEIAPWRPVTASDP